jgi:hypothetical protein
MGELPKDSSVGTICDLCATYVFVTLNIIDEGDVEAYCQCKDFWATARCEHALAALSLEGAVDIKGMRETITGPRKSGRPKNASKGGYGDTPRRISVTQSGMDHTLHINNAAKYLQSRIAKQFLEWSKTKVWYGVVKGD